MIDKLIIQLMAIQNYCKDIHYNCKGEAFYSKHLLVDRVQENISEYIDSIKELFYLSRGQEPKPSQIYLAESAKIIPAIQKDDKDSFQLLSQLIISALEIIDIANLTIAESNLVGNIAENLQASLGLIVRQIKG